jgi:ATP-dependent helicase/nuclease subunit B
VVAPVFRPAVAQAAKSTSQIDRWLLGGGRVVTASERAARALVSAFHRARQAEGLTAWPVPNVQDWKSFARTAWEERAAAQGDGRLLLNTAQEEALWVEIAAQDRSLATLLEGPRHRLASLAMEAHQLLCSYAPVFLAKKARSAWQQDAAAFSAWLAAFDETCISANLLSPSRLSLELIPMLEPDLSQRSPLLLAGFDRILPLQRSLFDAWGSWQEAVPASAAAEVHFHATPDAQSELGACALWASRRLALAPNARLLIVTQEASACRGEIERAFLRLADPGAAPLFEFSLGIPLIQAAPAHAAQLVLRWLSAPLREDELDWLLSTGLAANPEETAALQTTMRALRQRGLERTQWTLDAFLGQHLASALLPAAWVQRILQARRLLQAVAHRRQTPIEWAELVPELLDAAGFAHTRPLSSAEFQAIHRWQQALEICGSLGFDGRRMTWPEFVSQLDRTLNETLFAPESRDAPIQIAGPAESAGLTADAVWFLGANEDVWPAKGPLHPLLPPEVQREAGMPHAAPQLDWDLAQAITARLLASAPEVHFSFARQTADAETRPSRLVVPFAGLPQPLSAELSAPSAPPPQTVPFEDFSRVPFPAGKAEGGSSVLTSQSQCPFKAFATARLAARGWNPAEAGLTPSQRGQLLHAVLHSVWAGPPDGIRTSDELQNLTDRKSFIAHHVETVLREEMPRAAREQMPRRYLELEEQRLIRLVAEWLEYEAARQPFSVAGTEVERNLDLAGLALKLRLDRIDQLNDGSMLVIDYKSGIVTPSSWDPPRPDDVQLPLYAGFALGDEELPGGLVFAEVRPGEPAFAGRVGDAAATLFPGLPKNNALMRNPFTAEMLIDWRECIEQLTGDFLAGKAEVDPREYPKTCERCDLQSLCRIQEHPTQFEDEDESENGEAADE